MGTVHIRGTDSTTHPCTGPDTAFDTMVLHVHPKAAAAGDLALMHNGDRITLDMPDCSLTLDAPEGELAYRCSRWTPSPAHTDRGYVFLYTSHVQQASQGADFDFLGRVRIAGTPGLPLRPPQMLRSIRRSTRTQP